MSHPINIAKRTITKNVRSTAGQTPMFMIMLISTISLLGVFHLSKGGKLMALGFIGS